MAQRVFAILAENGTGKTSITLRALLALKDAGIMRRALVVAPLRVAYEVWPKEPAEWANSPWKRLNELNLNLLHGKDKEKRLKLDADMYVINVDGLRWLFKDALEAAENRVKEGAARGVRVSYQLRARDYEKFNALGIDTLVIDESSKFKNWSTQRFKLMKPLLDGFARRWILTGSPNPRSYLDLFSQFFIVDQGRALGRYITHYKQTYFTPMDNMGWTWALKAGADKTIQAAVAPYVFRLDAEDYLELPQLVPNVIRVELPKDARRVYDELEEELITKIGRKVVTAASAGVAAMKCGQVANGGLYYQEQDEFGKRTWNDVHWEKANAVKDLTDELQGSPALIVYEFEHDLERLKKTLEYDFHEPYYIGGGVSAKRSAELIAMWNRDELPYLLVHKDAVSHGLNLQKGTAKHIIWHSLTHDYEAFDQLNRRLRRQGSRQTQIFCHFIVASKTVDEAKLKNLRRKEKSQTDFLAALKEYCNTKRKD